jgi:hypothetical protein
LCSGEDLFEVVSTLLSNDLLSDTSSPDWQSLIFTSQRISNEFLHELILAVWFCVCIWHLFVFFL